MLTTTRFVLRHKLLVVTFWLALAVAGAFTASTTTGRLTTTFDMPGPAFDADTRIAQVYGVDAQDPVLPVITLPVGQTVDDPGVLTRLDRAFGAAAQAVPGARVIDLVGTGDRAFASSDGRSTFALVTVPAGNPDGRQPGRCGSPESVRWSTPPRRHRAWGCWPRRCSAVSAR